MEGLIEANNLGVIKILKILVEIHNGPAQRLLLNSDSVNEIMKAQGQLRGFRNLFEQIELLLKELSDEEIK